MFFLERPLLRIRRYLELVRFSHTLFAMPFALLSMLVAAEGLPATRVFGWILLCLVAARTAAMTFNRIADRHLDAINPRTQDRHLVVGTVSLIEAWGILVVSSALFILGAYMLNPLAFSLSPMVLIVLFGYSYTKRFTTLSHLVLGLSLGMAPVGSWIAVRGSLDFPPVILGAGVLCWVAGFDIIYALADEEFDRKTGLYSMVVRFGQAGALRISQYLHGFSAVLVMLFGWVMSLGLLFWIGWLLFALALVVQHTIVRPNDISRVNVAFFSVNGVVSILLFLFGAADILLP